MKQVEVVGAVVVNEQKDILCGLRSKEMILGGLWEFPGGKIEPGETHAQTLVREIQEELGCTVRVDEFITECLHEYEHLQVRLFTYYAHIESGTPSAREHERLAWVPAQQLLGLTWAPADLPTVHKVIRDLTNQ